MIASTVFWGRPLSVVHTSRMYWEIALRGSRANALPGRLAQRTARTRHPIRGRIEAFFFISGYVSALLNKSKDTDKILTPQHTLYKGILLVPTLCAEATCQTEKTQAKACAYQTRGIGRGGLPGAGLCLGGGCPPPPSGARAQIGGGH